MTSSQAATQTVFTIGHSNLELEEFLSTLSRHGVQTVCDVRSRPASFRFPQFNRESFEVNLRDAGFHYEFFGESLGGEASRSSCLSSKRPGGLFSTPKGARFRSRS